MPEYFPYDRTVRELLQRIPLRFTELLTGRQIREVLDPTLPRVQERRADFVGRLDDGRVVHVEAQVQYDPTLPERMVEYFLGLKQRFGQCPVQILLYLGDGKPPYDGQLRIGPLSFSYTVRDIKELSCEALLESSDPNDNILAVLCRRGEDFWERLTERLMKIPEAQRGDYVIKLAYLVKLREDILIEYEALREEVRKMPIVIDLEKDPARLNKKLCHRPFLFYSSTSSSFNPYLN